MSFINYKLSIINYQLSIILLLASCSDDDKAVHGPSISFRVINPEDTRAQVNSIGDVSPGFWLHVTDAEGEEVIDEFALYNMNTGQVSLSQDFYWPEGSLTFAALSDGNSMMVSSPMDSEGLIQIDCASGTKDYVAAYTTTSQAETTGGTVNLEFKHILAYAQIWYKATPPNDDSLRYYSINSCQLSGVYPVAYFNPKSLTDGGVRAWTDKQVETEGDRYESFYHDFLDGASMVVVEPDTLPKYLKSGSFCPYDLLVIPGEYTLSVSYTVSTDIIGGAPARQEDGALSTRAMASTQTYSKNAKVTLQAGRYNALVIDISGDVISGGSDNDDPSAPDNPEAE